MFFDIIGEGSIPLKVISSIFTPQPPIIVGNFSLLVTHFPYICLSTLTTMSRKYSDEEILSRLKTGDGKVIRYLVNEQLPVISYYIIKNGGNEEDAKDLFQDALFILIERVRAGNLILVSSLSTYLYAICKNLWKMVIEKRKAAHNYQSHILSIRHSDDFTERADHQFYERIFMLSYQEMDDQCRTILKMYWKEIPPEKIATVLDYSYAFLRKKKSKCMKELKRKIMSHPDYKELEKNLNIK